MPKHCPANERIKRDYFLYLKEAQRYSDASISGVAAAIARFEAYNGHKDFKRFHKQQAVKFKDRLAAQTNAATGKPLSLATQGAMLNTLRAFFVWLAAQPGFRSRFTYSMPIISTNPRETAARRKPTRPALSRPWHKRSMPSAPCQ